MERGKIKKTTLFFSVVVVFFFIVNVPSSIPTLHELLVVGRAADALDGDAGIVECLLLEGGLDLLNRALLDRLSDGVQVLKRTTWHFKIINST
jgi:hypothetical protein